MCADSRQPLDYLRPSGRRAAVLWAITRAIYLLPLLWLAYCLIDLMTQPHPEEDIALLIVLSVVAAAALALMQYRARRGRTDAAVAVAVGGSLLALLVWLLEFGYLISVAVIDRQIPFDVLPFDALVVLSIAVTGMNWIVLR